MFLVGIVSCIFLQACSGGKKAPTKLDRINWVLGYWEMSSPQGTVGGQNDGQPVTFREASFSDSMVVFENKGHDFPRRIVYVKQGEERMLAYIEGEVNGEYMKMEYPYVKH